jgi:hypothetical protein
MRVLVVAAGLAVGAMIGCDPPVCPRHPGLEPGTYRAFTSDTGYQAEVGTDRRTLTERFTRAGKSFVVVYRAP